MIRLVLIAVIFASSVLHSTGYEITGNNEVSYERALYKYLMKGNYSSTVRPVRNDSDTLDVELYLYISMLLDLDEVNQALRASGWLKMKWNDFQLTWPPEKFGNVNKTRVNVYRLWYPDIAIINSIDANMLMPHAYQQAIVYSNGDVMWVPALNIRTFCPLDLTHFPFDEHTCLIILTSWTYDEVAINLTIADAYFPWTIESSEWELYKTDAVRYSKYYSCCPNPYVEVSFEMKLRRKPTFATHLFVGPSVTLCLITPAIFILPPVSYEKLTFGTGLLVGHVLLLGELIKFVPSAHPSVPLMGKFFLANIVVVSLSLAVSVVVMNVWNRSQTRSVGPANIFRTILLNSVLLKILLIDLDDYDEGHEVALSTAAGSGSVEVMSDIAVHDTVDSSGRSTTDDRARIVDQMIRASVKSDWRRLAIVIDRIFFIVFAVILLATCLAFTGYL